MENRSFPRWTAPIVGALTGVYLGLQAGTVACLVCGVVFGLIAGGIVCLLDSQTKRKPQQEIPDDLKRFALEPSLRESSLISRFLALLSVLISCVPLVGLLVSLFAVLMNIHVEGWPRITSWVGFVLAAVASVLFSIAWLSSM